jgi:hypothetical protein
MPTALAATLVPHRAAYRLSLAPTPQTQLAELQGRLVIEWKATCDLWVSYQRMAFVAVQRDGRMFGHDVHYSSAEAVDGSALQFAVQTFDGPDPAEAYRGRAELQPGEVGAAVFVVPEAERIELPADTTFPAAQLEDVLRRADQDEQLVTHRVFDGWGYDSLVQVTTVIGAREARAPDGPGLRDPGAEAWPVSMAYYDPSGETDVPDFEAAYLLSSSGVMHELELNYGDFTIDGELAEIELFERPDC